MQFDWQSPAERMIRRRAGIRYAEILGVFGRYERRPTGRPRVDPGVMLVASVDAIRVGL
jgi:hypothetical protein